MIIMSILKNFEFREWDPHWYQMTIKKLHKLEDSYTSQHDNLFLDRSWYNKNGKVQAKHHTKKETTDGER